MERGYRMIHDKRHMMSYQDKEMPLDGCIVYANVKYWKLNGLNHREDGPAVEWTSGHKEWCINGKCHREDGPAVVYNDGSEVWWLNGEIHREGAPAVIWKSDGSEEWWLNGKYHREDGPAFSFYGMDMLCKHGVFYTAEEFHSGMTKHELLVNEKIQVDLK